MKIKKLSLKNIRSYKEEEIIFPEGSILLAGDIGSGKTSILLALEYSLFGLQPGQRGASLLRNGENVGEVTLEMEIGEKLIVIERKLRRNNKSVTNEYASLTINNEKIEASLTEIKTKILELMNYPYEFVKKNNLLYRYTVYTPQEHMKQIILEDPETRLNILRHILGIDKYKRIRENTILLVNQLKEESKILVAEIRNLDEDKTRLEVKKKEVNVLELELASKMSELNVKISTSSKVDEEFLKLEERIKEKIFLEKELEKSKIMIAGKYDNLSNTIREVKELEGALSEIGEMFDEIHYKEIVLRIEKNSKIFEELSNHYTNVIAEVNMLERQKKDTLAKKERVFKIEMCPTCLQDVTESHKHNILNEAEGFLSQFNQKIIALEKNRLVLVNEIEKVRSERLSLENEKTSKEMLRSKIDYVEKSKKKKEVLSKNIENLNEDIKILQQHAITLREKISSMSVLDNLLRLKKNELNEAKQQEKSIEINIATIKKEIEINKRDIVFYEEFIASKELTKKNLNYILELHDWISSGFLELIDFIERNVLLRLRQEFSGIFSKWFSILVPFGVLSVRLDESFSPIILHRDIEMEYSFLSGGERTAVALAYRLALNQTINSMLSKLQTKDIVILDEPTDGFSEVQLDKMREVLNELNVSQLVIVSHERKMESFVDNVIRVKKIGEVSCLEPNSPLSLYIK